MAVSSRHTVIDVTRTVELLLFRTGIASDSIDKECNDDHILKISRFLENWELVASFLGLKPPQIEEVKHDSNHDLKLMRLKALRKWKSLFAFNATYRVLLGALLESGSTEQAFQVCRLLNPNQVDVQSRPDVPTLEPYEPDSIGQALVPSSSPRSTGASGEYNCGHQTIVHCSEKITAGLSKEPKLMAVVLHSRGFISTETLREVTELPATKTDNATKLYLSILETVQHHPHRYSEFISILHGNTLLYSDLLKVLEETYQEKEKDAENQLVLPTLDLHQPHCQSLVPSSPTHSTGNSPAEVVHSFESRFHYLRKSALDEVTERGVTVKDFRQTIMTLPYAISKEHEQFLLSKYHLFENAPTIERIFLHLNLYLSFIDFSLLEHIIEHFGSHGLQQKMKQYSRDMEMFSMETPVIDIIQFIPHLSDGCESPPHFARLKMKLNFDPTTCTLGDLEQHRKKFGGEFSLSKFALFLVEIGEGSLVEVYLVLSDIVPALKDLVQKKSLTFFLNLEILKLSVNEECLYPFSTPKRVLAIGSSSSQPTSTQTEIGSQTSFSEQSTSSAGWVLDLNVHLGPLRMVVLEAAYQWKDIGRALPGVTEGNIQSIRFSEDSECLNAVLSKWIITGRAKTNDLLEALEEPTVGRTDIANTIRNLKGEERAKVGLDI